MKVLHYIPSIDRSSGGTTAYIQLLANELGKLTELHIVSHKEKHPINIKNSTIHYISPSVLNGMKKEWEALLQEIHPDIIHINCCWMPGCAFTQKWAQQLGYKVVLTPHGIAGGLSAGVFCSFCGCYCWRRWINLAASVFIYRDAGSSGHWLQ